MKIDMDPVARAAFETWQREQPNPTHALWENMPAGAKKTWLSVVSAVSQAIEAGEKAAIAATTKAVAERSGRLARERKG